jgi:hypothetical protein
MKHDRYTLSVTRVYTAGTPATDTTGNDAPAMHRPAGVAQQPLGAGHGRPPSEAGAAVGLQGAIQRPVYHAAPPSVGPAPMPGASFMGGPRAAQAMSAAPSPTPAAPFSSRSQPPPQISNQRNIPGAQTLQPVLPGHAQPSSTAVHAVAPSMANGVMPYQSQPTPAMSAGPRSAMMHHAAVGSAVSQAHVARSLAMPRPSGPRPFPVAARPLAAPHAPQTMAYAASPPSSMSSSASAVSAQQRSAKDIHKGV